MYGCNHSIDGCLQVSAWRVGEALNHIDGLQVSAWRVGEALNHIDGLQVSAWRVGEALKVTCGIVCSVNKDAYIRFKDSLLLWYDSDNNEGVIKYNTLVASGNWSLEEVEIEELL